ncbi:MAG: AI-2E family transporter [Deltaproteobacteria bacterium]|nr:AI-2E family transporter [Deltaproteobacteria bacterium]
MFAALWVLMAAALVAFRHVLLPFAIAFVVAYLLEPLVSRLCRWRIRGRALPRWVAVIALYLVFFGGLYLFGRLAVPQLWGELATLTRKGRDFFNGLTPERINEYSSTIEGWLYSRGIPLELSAPGEESGRYGLSFDLEHSIRQGLDGLSKAMKTHFFDAVGWMQKLVGGVLEFVFRFFFILMVAAFMLVDWQRIGRYARSLVPPQRRDDFGELLTAMDEKLSGVVRGQALICLVNGTLTAVGLILLRVPFVFVLSTLATVLSAIPIFGTIISSVPIVLIGLTQGLKTGLGALLWIVGIHALEAYVLNPKIMGAHAHIHPVLVAFALLAGELTFGFVGALFAVPVAGILIAGFELLHERAQRKLAPAPPPAAPNAQ